MRKERKLDESMDAVNIKSKEGNNDRWDVTIGNRAWIMHPGLMARAVLVLPTTAALRFLSSRSLSMPLYPSAAGSHRQGDSTALISAAIPKYLRTVRRAKMKSTQLNAQKEGFRKVLTMLCENAE